MSPPAHSAPWRVGLATAFSVATHAALVGLAASLPEPPTANGSAIAPVPWTELIFEAPRPRDEIEVSPTPAPGPPLTPDLRRRRLSLAALIVGPTPTLAPAPTIEAPPPVAASATPTPASRARTPEELRALLDPRAAVSRVYVPTGPGPSPRGAPAGLDVDVPGPTAEEIGRRLARGLRDEALATTHLGSERLTPRRQSDGTYLYEGHAFDATIRLDGSVDWNDHPHFQVHPESGSASWDLEAAVAGAAGVDLYAAERQRFLDDTQELRDQLEEAHRREERRRGVVLVRGRLRRAWEDTRRSEAARRRALFETWDAIAEDGSMGEVRAEALAWIREHLSEGSDRAYPEAELARLNASRSSVESFSPY